MAKRHGGCLVCLGEGGKGRGKSWREREEGEEGEGEEKGGKGEGGKITKFNFFSRVAQKKTVIAAPNFWDGVDPWSGVSFIGYWLLVVLVLSVLLSLGLGTYSLLVKRAHKEKIN
jgi:hypothetical protein